MLKNKAGMLSSHLHTILVCIDPSKLKSDERALAEICSLALELEKVDKNFNIISALAILDKDAEDKNPTLTEMRIADADPKEILKRLRELHEKDKK